MSTIETQFCAFSSHDLCQGLLLMVCIELQKEYSWLYKLIMQMKKIVPQVVLLAQEPRDMALQKLARTPLFFLVNNSVEDLVTILGKRTWSGGITHLILSAISGFRVFH